MAEINNNSTNPVTHFGMWVAFQYIILFICLYVYAVSFGGILHYGVDKFFKDTIDNFTYSKVNVNGFLLRGYIAGIIVTYPVFAILFLVLKKQATKLPEVKVLKARKFLIYATLVITFLIMIGHLIATLYGFLDGKTTINSLAHLGVTCLVAGSIFVYLMLEVWSDRSHQ